MRRRDVLTLGAASLVWPGFAQPAASESNKFALVIGNAAYNEGVGPLNNPVNDAARVASALSDCGFRLFGGDIAANLERGDFMRAIRQYVRVLADAGTDAIGYFYYSGHGAAHPERGNHLIPVGDYLELNDELWDDSIALSWLFNRLGGVRCPQIVNIDACRNVLRLPDPSKNLAGGQPFRGLRVERAAVQRPNMFLSYATWEGQLASDGNAEDGSGPYAAALASNMERGGRTVRDMFEDVRLDVLELTGQVQEPMNISRLHRESKDLSLVADDGEAVIGGLLGIGNDELLNISAKREPLNQALVIANDYSDTPEYALRNVRDDGSIVSEALTQSGFETELLVNATRRDTLEGLDQLVEKLTSAGSSSVGLVYFAGLGGVYQGDNYVIPAGEIPDTGSDLPNTAIRIEDVIRAMESAPSEGLICLIDCGRVVNDVRARSLQKGFAESYGHNRVIIAHATSPGETTEDDQAPSYFARAFAEEVLTPERRDVETVLNDVRQRVRLQTGGGQLPYFLSTARAPIFFRSGTGLDQTNTEAQVQPGRLLGTMVIIDNED
ncbi:MAG: caspase family protein [Pseudomonadota bacterium]